jgi:hypothetical protein
MRLEILLPVFVGVLVVLVCLVIFRKKIDKVLVWHHFLHSNYITALWDWFMELAGKAAEPVLFATVLYSGYELLPDVPQPGAGVDAFVFICQMITLDIGGLGLIKMAQNKGLDRRSFPQRVGYVLLGLMIANVSLAMLKRIFHIGPGWENGIEGTLLLARAIMAVLYGYAIHSLKDDAPESTRVVKMSTVEDMENKFTEQIQAMTETSAEQIRQMTENTACQIRSVEQRLAEKTEQQIRSVLANITEQIRAQSEQDRTFTANKTEHIRASFHASLQPVLETLEQHKATLARVGKELREDRTPNVPPNVRQFAPKTEHRTRPNESPNTEFDKGAFVRSCLAEVPNIRNAEIQRRAEEIGQTISPAYISEVRKAFSGEFPAVNE